MHNYANALFFMVDFCVLEINEGRLKHYQNNALMVVQRLELQQLFFQGFNHRLNMGRDYFWPDHKTQKVKKP